MSSEFPPVPPGQIWIPVWDLPSALLAIEWLIDYIRSSDAETAPSDYDEI